MKPRKKKPAPSECGLTGAQAQAAYEQALSADAQGKAPARDLAAHIAGCEPCSSALQALELQGDAVSELAKEPRQPGDTAVESILRVAARSGTGKFADLAYELAKACLIRLPNLERRVRRVVEPREAPVVARELRKVHERGGATTVRSVSLGDLPRESPAETEALRAAASCLRLLEQVEGATPRHVLGMSQVYIFEKRPEKAEELLRELLTTPVDSQMRRHAYRNLMLAFIRQEKCVDALRMGDEALRNSPDDWQVLFNQAVAHAHLGQRQQFRTVARRIAEMAAASDSTYLSTLVQFELPRLARDLGSSLPEVERAFGMHRGTRSR